MRLLKLLAAIAGIFLVFAGGLFALQGLGLVMWPAESFMLADRSWALYGGLIVLVGALLLYWSTRRRR